MQGGAQVSLARNSAATESEGGQKFLPPNPPSFLPARASDFVPAARSAAIKSFVQKRFEQRSVIATIRLVASLLAHGLWPPSDESNNLRPKMTSMVIFLHKKKHALVITCALILNDDLSSDPCCHRLGHHHRLPSRAPRRPHRDTACQQARPNRHPCIKASLPPFVQNVYQFKKISQ